MQLHRSGGQVPVTVIHIFFGQSSSIWGQTVLAFLNFDLGWKYTSEGTGFVRVLQDYTVLTAPNISKKVLRL